MCIDTDGAGSGIVNWLNAVLCDPGEELEYLADHPDPDVREVLAEVLESYRGREVVTRIAAEHGPPPESMISP
jgi:hypothetical protein